MLLWGTCEHIARNVYHAEIDEIEFYTHARTLEALEKSVFDDFAKKYDAQGFYVYMSPVRFVVIVPARNKSLPQIAASMPDWLIAEK